MGLVLPFLWVQAALCDPADFTWSRALRDTGFGEGLSAQGAAPDLNAYWTVPPDARGGTATLLLRLAIAAPEGFDGRIDVALDGAPAASFVPRAGAHSETLDLAVPASALLDGIVDLKIAARRYGSAQSCAGRRDIAVSLRPESALRIALSPGPDAAARLALLPTALSARIPPGPMTGEMLRNIAVMAAQLTREGHRISFTTDEDKAAAISFVAQGEAPFLGAEETLKLPATREMADAIARDDGRAMSWPDNERPVISLAAPGVTPEARQADPQAEWTFALPLREMPADLQPVALELDVTAPLDPEGARQSLALYANGALVASELLQLSRAARHVVLPIPRGALNANNFMKIVFTRIGVDKVCGHETRSLPVSLGPDALVALGPAPRAIEQFFEFSRAQSPAIALWIDPDLLAEPTRALPFAVALTASTLRDLTQLNVETIGAGVRDGTQPFLYLSPAPPLARIEPARPGIETAVSFARLISDEGAPGIWLRPAPGGGGAALLPLDRGDFALFEPDGATHWFNSRPARRQTVFSAQSEPLRRLVKRYWPWAAGLLWLSLTGATLIALARKHTDRP